MSIIKEICIYNQVGVVRSDSYGSTIEHLNALAAVAKSDFGLTDKDIEVKHYAGIRYKRTYGVEFRIPEGCEVPPDYVTISRLENTF